MSRGKTLPRFENPASLEIGDVIRVTWKVRDVEHTRTGKISRIIDDGGYKVFATEEGQEIFHWSATGGFQPRVTLLAVAEAVTAHSLLEGILV